MSPFRIAMWSEAHVVFWGDRISIRNGDMGLESRCEHQNRPPRPKSNMVSTLRPVPSLICWQIRCLVVIPAGEGLHEGAIAIRVEHGGDFMPSCGTPYGLPCPPRGDRPSWEGIYPDPGECRGRPQLLYRATFLP